MLSYLKDTKIQKDILKQSERAAYEDVVMKKALDDSGYVDANKSPDVPNDKIRVIPSSVLSIYLTQQYYMIFNSM